MCFIGVFFPNFLSSVSFFNRKAAYISSTPKSSRLVISLNKTPPGANGGVLPNEIPGTFFQPAPYILTASALFYEDLKNENTQQSED